MAVAGFFKHLQNGNNSIMNWICSTQINTALIQQDGCVYHTYLIYMKSCSYSSYFVNTDGSSKMVWTPLPPVVKILNWQVHVFWKAGERKNLYLFYNCFFFSELNRAVWKMYGNEVMYLFVARLINVIWRWWNKWFWCCTTRLQSSFSPQSVRPIHLSSASVSICILY